MEHETLLHESWAIVLHDMIECAKYEAEVWDD